MKKVIETACTYDCPDACALLVENQGGGLRLRGHPGHPITRGFLCRRIRRHPERLKSPRRLLQPLLRQGTGFREATWPEALEAVARGLEGALAAGAESIVHVAGGGSLGLRKLLVRHFFHSLGPVTTLRGGVCDETGAEAQRRDFGTSCAHDYTDLENAAAVVLWGKNPAVTAIHLVPFIKRARQGGARVVLIDLWRTPSACLADDFIRVAPGGDGWLALAVLKLLAKEERLAPEAAARCENFPAFEKLLAEPAEVLAGRAGVALAEARLLARLYGGGRPVATWIGWGLQRRARGGLAVRLIDALCLLSGNVGRVGAGANYNPERKRGLDLSRLARPSGRYLDIPRFAAGLSNLCQPPARLVFINGGNPAAQYADSGAVVRALRAAGLVVVADAFFTDTARLADVVLPCTLMLEEEADAVGSFGHHWVARARRAADPPPGAKDDVEIVRELARVLGLKDDPLLASPEAALETMIAPWFAGDGESFCRNPAQSQVPFSDRFATASGMARLVEQIPDIVYPAADREPLLLSHKVREFEHSQRQPEDQKEPWPCFINPNSPAAAGFSNGELARLESRRGEMTVRLVFRADLHPGACAVPEGGWPSLGRGTNALVEERPTDMGGGTAFYDQKVSLKKFPPAGSAPRG